MPDETEPNVCNGLHASVQLTLIPGIGPRTYATLLNTFGSAEAVLQQSAERLQQVPGIGAATANRFAEPSYSLAAAEMLERCRQLGIQLMVRGDRDYPSGVAEMGDAPPVLFVRGRIRVQDQLAVAIVGSRRCTTYGRRQAERLAAALARAGITVVSGLARGIDGAAHRGALAAGGRTLAVLATGVSEIYPPEHADLALEIVRCGALVSEFPLHQKPRPGLFPQRNRIISALSLGVIIVEATRNSGALYTARHAMEQGREVFALPGPVDSIASEGCHELIRDGATLVRNVDDVLQGLGPLPQPATSSSGDAVHDPRELSLNDQEREVLNLIGHQPTSVDQILRAAKLDPSRVLSTLTVLEMKRFARRLPGNQLVRN